LAAWSEWGPKSLDRLVGMFAFAVLELDAERVFLARDPFGIKPLYVASWDGGVAFASEISPLLELPQVSTHADVQAVYDYARYGLTDHGERTCFRDVRRVPPASFLEVSLHNAACGPLHRYWEPSIKSNDGVSFEEASKHLRELFIESVALHLRSDVPLGVLLSGGIDSSAVISVMRRLEPNMEVRAFSYIADDRTLSEERWVDLLSATTSARLHKISASPIDLVDDLDELVRLQGEPFGSTSIYAAYKVVQGVQSDGISVLLDGQGADELLAGYPVYAAARLASLVKQGRVLEAGSFLANLSRGSEGRAIALRSGMFLVPARLQTIARPLVGRSYIPRWISRDWVAEHNIERKPPRSKYGRDVLRDELLDAVSRLHLPSLLRYEDRTAMAHSIEARVPFLTVPMAEFVLSLPEDYLVSSDGTTKSVFRAAMRGIVPDAVLDRRDKIGFATPEQSWLEAQERWVEERLTDDRLQRIPMLDPVAVRAEWEAVKSRRKRFDFRIWRCVNLSAWTDAFEAVHS